MAESQQYTEIGDYLINMDLKKCLGRTQKVSVHPGTHKMGNPEVAGKLFVWDKELKHDMVDEEVATMRAIPRHANVLQLLDYEKVEVGEFKELWLILEYCRLGSLEKFVKNYKLTLPQKIDLMLQSAKGVRHLHHLETPVIHRDIKPANLLLTGNPYQPLVKVADYGESRYFTGANEHSLRNMTAAGTPYYQAPELYSDSKSNTPAHNKAVDVFALGVSFQYLLDAEQGVGSTPITVDEKALGRHMHENSDTDVRKLLTNPTDSDDVNQVKSLICQMLVKDPKCRILIDDVVDRLFELRTTLGVKVLLAIDTVWEKPVLYSAEDFWCGHANKYDMICQGKEENRMVAAVSASGSISHPSTSTTTTSTQPFETRSFLLYGLPSKVDPEAVRRFIGSKLEERQADYRVESVLGPFSSAQFTGTQMDSPCMIITLSSERGLQYVASIFEGTNYSRDQLQPQMMGDCLVHLNPDLLLEFSKAEGMEPDPFMDHLKHVYGVQLELEADKTNRRIMCAGHWLQIHQLQAYLQPQMSAIPTQATAPVPPPHDRRDANYQTEAIKAIDTTNVGDVHTTRVQTTVKHACAPPDSDIPHKETETTSGARPKEPTKTRKLKKSISHRVNVSKLHREYLVKNRSWVAQICQKLPDVAFAKTESGVEVKAVTEKDLERAVSLLRDELSALKAMTEACDLSNDRVDEDSLQTWITALGVKYPEVVIYYDEVHQKILFCGDDAATVMYKFISQLEKYMERLSKKKCRSEDIFVKKYVMAYLKVVDMHEITNICQRHEVEIDFTETYDIAVCVFHGTKENVQAATTEMNKLVQNYAMKLTSENVLFRRTASKEKQRTLDQLEKKHSHKVLFCYNEDRTALYLVGEQSAVRSTRELIEALLGTRRKRGTSLTRRARRLNTEGEEKRESAKPTKPDLDRLTKFMGDKPSISTRHFASSASSGDRKSFIHRHSGTAIHVLQYDITKLHVDAIINPTNSYLKLQSGVGGAISRAAGPELARECDDHVRAYGLQEVASVFVSGAGALPCRHVMHAVSPATLRDGSGSGLQDVQHLLFNCLTMADKWGLTSVAFPPIGAGNLGASASAVADMFAYVIANYFTNNASSKITSMYIVDVASELIKAIQFRLSSDVCLREIPFAGESPGLVSTTTTPISSSSSRLPFSSQATGVEDIGKSSYADVTRPKSSPTRTVVVTSPHHRGTWSGGISGGYDGKTGGGLRVSLPARDASRAAATSSAASSSAADSSDI